MPSVAEPGLCRGYQSVASRLCRQHGLTIPHMRQKKNDKIGHREAQLPRRLQQCCAPGGGLKQKSAWQRLGVHIELIYQNQPKRPSKPNKSTDYPLQDSS